MTPVALLFADLEGELKTTRRMLERVPNGQDDWRPHEKSMTLGQLATHVAQLPGLGILMLTQEEFDGAAPRPRRPDPANSAERVKLFDAVSAEMRALLERMTWDQAWRSRACICTSLASRSRAATAHSRTSREPRRIRVSGPFLSRYLV